MLFLVLDEVRSDRVILRGCLRGGRDNLDSVVSDTHPDQIG